MLNIRGDINTFCLRYYNSKKIFPEIEWFNTFEQAGMVLEILYIAYVFNKLNENINHLYTEEQQKILLKKILLIHPLEDEKRQKNKL